MKTIFTLFISLTTLFAGTVSANTYNITTNSSWSAAIPATCPNCTINISSGVTLTVDEGVTCQSCTFSGGNMTMGAFTMNLQSASGTYTVNFTGVNFTINSGTVTVNEPLFLTNSTFTFNGSSTLSTSYQDDLVNSKIKLNGSSKFTATGASTVNINLSSGSEVQVGDGTSSSSANATFTVSGPTLNLYDTSSVAVESNYNDFFDWNNYNTASSAAGAKTSHTTYNNANANLDMNCGGIYPNSCSNPNLYGPATLSSSGTTQGAVLLPVLLEDFTAELNVDRMVNLSWATTQESNSSHFDIERSQDGSSWTVIGTVQAQGTSATTVEYSFTDETPATGANYYRLNMVDRDGRYAYSDVKIVSTSTLVSKVSVYPNPASNYVNVSFGQASSGAEVTVRLISQSGQVLQEKKAIGGNGTSVTFPVQQYSTGLYILSVSGADGEHVSSKLLISHS